MVGLTAPLRLAGAVDQNSLYGDVYGAVLEHVPDLTYPMSVPVYSAMRRDAQLAAVLAGYTLQLRRASWQVDGRGCRPEVAQLVADGLGLNVAGQDVTSGARLRGVSWNEHLRAALSMLVFGHAGFELQADPTGGVARLTGLWERPQHTISRIHVDGATGALLGVTQSAGMLSRRPQISAERMVWYVHDREGAAYQGVSLLRPAYAGWLLKREMMRVAATSNRRFGTGVPNVQWDAGTNPTGEQQQQALDAASAARVGETAGASFPPGARLVLTGLSGSAPDTLGFIRWLDQQMSRQALMGHLDLGETANGSRALGSTFVDVLMMALESIGEHVADTVTRQVAARVVEWNYGLDEAVPRVTVSGVGSQREVTAEALDLLMRSGALSADPGLEAWVRREYRLPEREAPVPPAPVTPPPAPVAAGTSRPRAKRKRTPGQLALFAAAEDPEPDHAAIQQQWETAKADLLARWTEAAQPVVDELTTQAEAAAAADDLGLLGTLAVSAGVVAAVALLIGGTGVGLAVEAAAGVVAEAAAQGVDITAPEQPGAERVRQTADAVAAVICAGYASGAARAALQIAGADPDTVRDAVEAHLTELGTSTNGLVGDNVGALLVAAQFAGRLAVLEANPADSYISVEANDGPSRCDPCSAVNGTTYPTLSAALADYPQSGSFRECAGGSRCHGFVAPRWS